MRDTKETYQIIAETFRQIVNEQDKYDRLVNATPEQKERLRAQDKRLADRAADPEFAPTAKILRGGGSLEDALTDRENRGEQQPIGQIRQDVESGTLQPRAEKRAWGPGAAPPTQDPREKVYQTLGDNSGRFQQDTREIPQDTRLQQDPREQDTVLDRRREVRGDDEIRSLQRRRTDVGYGKGGDRGRRHELNRRIADRRIELRKQLQGSQNPKVAPPASRPRSQRPEGEEREDYSRYFA